MQQTVDIVPTPLAPERLRWRCDPETLSFESTEDVAALAEIIGQDRGVEAIDFGLEMAPPGYNVYVAGPAGTGRTTALRRQVEAAAKARPAPADWCYVHNFADPYQPIALQLPAGSGPELERDLAQIVAGCKREIPKAFESEHYETQRSAIFQDLQSRTERVFDELRPEADRLGFIVQPTPGGIISTPTMAPGTPMSAEAFELLPDAKKAQIRANSQRLQRLVEDAMSDIRRLEREAFERRRDLDRDTARFAIGHLFDALSPKYAQHPAVVRHLDAVEADVLEHLGDFNPGAQHEHDGRTPTFERYEVNALVTSDPQGGAPVLFEANPTYYNLVGRFDFRATFGAMQTDFTLIKPGALHRANGGYLILRARDLLSNPFSWEALKRSLREREVRVETLGEQMSLLPMATLKPQPVPLDVKVIVIGDPFTYLMLYRLDEDFAGLFKVKAQFSGTMERTEASIRSYAAFVSTVVHGCALLPFSREAVARIAEFGARLAEDQSRLSARFDMVEDLARESDYRARGAGVAIVGAAHVDQAIAAQERRVNLPEEDLQRIIDQGTIEIDTTSRVVGQVNGLAIMDLGDYRFARPSRISARVGAGAEGVVDIEREVLLSGPSHSKGVLTLTGYLLGKYAEKRPISMSARLMFEQLHSPIDGDSASGAELCALLSALADLPINQGIALTGAINQHGRVQAVGGVTHKIEGHFAVCRAMGLTGAQGVIIPQANVRNLMLKPEVVEAVRNGEFHVWAVTSVDEALQILTGIPAGARQPDGTYQKGTVHGRVAARLAEFAEALARSNRRPRLHRAPGPTGAADGVGQP